MLSWRHSTSYFFPGKLEGLPIQFLIDTGCITNLLSKPVFDKLPQAAMDLLEESDSHRLMAVETWLPFYEVVRLPIQL